MYVYIQRYMPAKHKAQKSFVQIERTSYLGSFCLISRTDAKSYLGLNAHF